MSIIERLFGKKSKPQSSRERPTVADVPLATSSTSQGDVRGSALLAEFDSLKELRQLGRFLKAHSQAEIEHFIEGFPFSDLSLEYKSLERDFRNSTRCEMILHLARMLLFYKDYLADTEWTGILPTSLDAKALSDKLFPALMTFIEKQKGVDIAMSLRSALYDFAMGLIQLEKNREAMTILAVSNPSPREDHAFWLCACYYNVGQLEDDLQAVKTGIALAEDITSGRSQSAAGAAKKLRQTDFLSKLRELETKLSKKDADESHGGKETQAIRTQEEEPDQLEEIDSKYHSLAIAIKEWWRGDAIEWWASSGRCDAYCDREGEPVAKGEGYKTGRRLLCERCTDVLLTKHADWEQAVRDLNKWFGPGVPPKLQSQADSLWNAPKTVF